MAGTRDLLEAQRFSRRRLVSAFVTGSPDGRGTGPPRPGSLVRGGVALSVMLLAGAAIASWLAPAAALDWGRPSVVISQDTGQTYVMLEATGDPALHPVANVVSARLALGSDASSAPQIVPESALRGRSRGPAIGIPGAPDSVPSVERLVDTGWTACTADHRGIELSLTTSPDAEAADGRGVVVRTGSGASWVVATSAARTGEVTRAHRYRVPDHGSTQDLMLAALGLGPRDAALVVPTDWVRLFPRGGDLDLESLELEHLGSPARGSDGTGVPPGARVGDWVVAGEGALLLTDRGLAPLEPWALAVHEAAVAELADSPEGRAPRRLLLDSLPGGPQVEPAYLAARWPRAPVEPLVGEPCAVLEAGSEHTPGVALAAHPGGRSTPTVPPVDQTRVRVESGRGAHVRSGGWGGPADGPPALVDDTGRLFPLDGDETADRLGYADHAPTGVPASWLSLLGRGVPLSSAAALCPPEAALSSSAGRAPPRSRTPRCGR